MLYPGLIVNATYEVVQEIGSGGMGVVYLAYHLRLDKYVVMKKIKASSADLSMLRNEADVLKSLRHTYLPQVYDFISFEGDTYTIIDYIEGYDLKYYIDNRIAVSESQLIKWLKQLCEVLRYLHTHDPKVLHADIKPANIIVQPSGDICLIDFGISMLGNEQMKGLSYEYSSPEQYHNLCCIKSGSYDALCELDDRTDIYSLGATFFQIVTLLDPSCQYEIPPTEQHLSMPMSRELCMIIDKACRYDRSKRYATAAQMYKALDEIYKLGSKYKSYLITQIVLSAAASLMIVLGAILLINGVYDDRKTSFEEDYNRYIAALDARDLSQAVSGAQDLINRSEYDPFMDEATAAEIYRGLGDCYRESGDDRNAVSCYAEALKNLSPGSASEALYRNYAMTLAESGQVDQANEILDELERFYPDSASGRLIRAQLAYLSGRYDEALTPVNEALSLPIDADTRYAAYILLGDIDYAQGDWKSADQAYRSAYQAKENPNALRKRGAVEIRLAVKNRSDAYYLSALECFEIIYERYAPTEDDVLNLGQCYLYSSTPNGAKKCVDAVKEFIDSGHESFRCYVLIAAAGDIAGDEHTAEYCRKAHNIYLAMNQTEKAQIDGDSLRKIRSLYESYTGEVW